MQIAELLTRGHYDETELAQLDMRQGELRAEINEAKAPDRRARADAACFFGHR